MGESKTIIEETKKSSSKSPLPRMSGSATPSAGLSEAGPFVKGGEHPRGTIFSPLYEERGVRGDFFGSSTSVFRLKEMWVSFHYPSGTKVVTAFETTVYAGRGPACPVVLEGRRWARVLGAPLSRLYV